MYPHVYRKSHQKMGNATSYQKESLKLSHLRDSLREMLQWKWRVLPHRWRVLHLQKGMSSLKEVYCPKLHIFLLSLQIQHYFRLLQEYILSLLVRCQKGVQLQCCHLPW